MEQSPKQHWFDPHHMSLILRVAKKTQGCIVHVTLVENESYRFQFIHEDRLWKIEHVFNGGNDFVLDFKKKTNQYCRRLENILHVSLNHIQNVTNDRTQNTDL